MCAPCHIRARSTDNNRTIINQGACMFGHWTWGCPHGWVIVSMSCWLNFVAENFLILTYSCVCSLMRKNEALLLRYCTNSRKFNVWYVRKRKNPLKWIDLTWLNCLSKLLRTKWIFLHNILVIVRRRELIRALSLRFLSTFLCFGVENECATRNCSCNLLQVNLIKLTAPFCMDMWDYDS